MMDGRKFSNIQILRAVAAFFVVFYHLQPWAIKMDTRPLNFGASGVDIFFVISGFVIFYANRAMTNEVGSFFIGRLIRIVPLYWLATLTLAALFAVGFHPAGNHELNAGILLRSLLFIQSEYAGGRIDLMLSVGWTLIYEMYFYLIFAVALRTRDMSKALLVVTGFFVATVSAGSLWQGKPYLVAYLTSPIVLEFLYGAWLAFGLQKLTLIDRPRAIAVASLAILIGLAGLSRWDVSGTAPAIPYFDQWRFLLIGAPAALIVAGALLLDHTGLGIRHRWALLFGAASYPLYLFHIFVVQPIGKVGLAFLPHTPFSFAIVVVSGLVASALLAITIHLWVEQPILRWGRRFSAKPMASRAQFVDRSAV